MNSNSKLRLPVLVKECQSDGGRSTLTAVQSHSSKCVVAPSCATSLSWLGLAVKQKWVKHCPLQYMFICKEKQQEKSSKTQ